MNLSGRVCARCLQITVLDKDMFSNDEIGVVTINLKELDRSVVYDNWYPLEKADNVKCHPSGSLRIRLLRTNTLLLSRILHAKHTVIHALKQTMRLLRGLYTSVGEPNGTTPTMAALLSQAQSEVEAQAEVLVTTAARAAFATPAPSTLLLDPEPRPDHKPRHVAHHNELYAKFDVLHSGVAVGAAAGSSSDGVEESKGGDDRTLASAVRAAVAAAAAAKVDHGSDRQPGAASAAAKVDLGSDRQPGAASAAPAAAPAASGGGDGDVGATAGPSGSAPGAGDVGGAAPSAGKAAGDGSARGRLVGHQLQVTVMEVEGVGQDIQPSPFLLPTASSSAGADGKGVKTVKPTVVHRHHTPHWMYATLRIGNAVRRSSVCPLGFSVPFLTTPLGLSFHQSSDAKGGHAKPGGCLILSAVTPTAVSRAVHPEYVKVAANIVPGMAITDVGGTSLVGLTTKQALAVMETKVREMQAALGSAPSAAAAGGGVGAAAGVVGAGVGVGVGVGASANVGSRPARALVDAPSTSYLWLRFATVDPLPVPDNHVNPTATSRRTSVVPYSTFVSNQSRFDSVADVPLAQRNDAWETHSTAVWREVFEFGDSVAPPSAFVPLLNGCAAPLGPDQTLEVCILERAYVADGSLKPGQSEGPLFGGGTCERRTAVDLPRGGCTMTAFACRITCVGGPAVARIVPRLRAEPLEDVRVNARCFVCRCHCVCDQSLLAASTRRQTRAFPRTRRACPPCTSSAMCRPLIAHRDPGEASCTRTIVWSRC